MLKIETFEALLEATDLETVLAVAAIGAINSATIPTMEECEGKASFQKRIERIFTDQLAANAAIPAKTAMTIFLTCNDYETRQAMQGLGGCVAKSLTDMLAEVMEPEPATPSMVM